ncbi:uncharacterized protein MONOS_18615 [Monocercomonoides exilis]|uniref:uncharacterized protein n=1 Tax=Monocercomonoides exilis TaxID=2049356 RepID=UPI0035593FB7|nr:hypothetical protein MONOS_18615 [Monocercomonoides exilis]
MERLEELSELNILYEEIATIKKEITANRIDSAISKVKSLSTFIEDLSKIKLLEMGDISFFRKLLECFKHKFARAEIKDELLDFLIQFGQKFGTNYPYMESEEPFRSFQKSGMFSMCENIIKKKTGVSEEQKQKAAVCIGLLGRDLYDPMTFSLVMKYIVNCLQQEWDTFTKNRKYELHLKSLEMYLSCLCSLLSFNAVEITTYSQQLKLLLHDVFDYFEPTVSDSAESRLFVATSLYLTYLSSGTNRSEAFVPFGEKKLKKFIPNLLLRFHSNISSITVDAEQKNHDEESDDLVCTTDDLRKLTDNEKCKDAVALYRLLCVIYYLCLDWLVDFPVILRSKHILKAVVRISGLEFNPSKGIVPLQLSSSKSYAEFEENVEEWLAHPPSRSKSFSPKSASYLSQKIVFSLINPRCKDIMCYVSESGVSWIFARKLVEFLLNFSYEKYFNSKILETVLAFFKEARTCLRESMEHIRDEDELKKVLKKRLQMHRIYDAFEEEGIEDLLDPHQINGDEQVKTFKNIWNYYPIYIHEHHFRNFDYTFKITVAF